VASLLARAVAAGRPLVQPRCGVGGHAAMRALLAGLERDAAPDLLTLTIDSHTRLLQFDSVARVLAADPGQLNGYPLVTHGWRRGRELAAAVRAPLQVRHGSPDPRPLFAVTVAAGITSFEGGGIGYNVPYAKTVPIRHSLRAWREVDRRAGELAADGLIVDREFFGTLTGVLVPPAIALSVALIEAVLAAAQGVRCLSVAYPQGGHPWQDLAALRVIPALAARYLGPPAPGGPVVYPVLHQFMGVFPAGPARALRLITYGGLIGAAGGVAKIVTKSPAEATGIPDLAANALGIATTRAGMDLAPGWTQLDETAVAEEAAAIEREVIDLVDPVLDAPDLIESVGAAFDDGRLDVPFAVSRYARSAVVPCRDASGAIRYADFGALPFSPAARRANAARLRGWASGLSLVDRLTRDIAFFSADTCPLGRYGPWWPALPLAA
jgi:methylaspartate mutase epsilon subunit